MRELTVLLLSLLIPVMGSAQPPAPPRTPPGDDVITPLSIGDSAPHQGMLLSTDTAIRWTFRLEWYAAELERQYRLRAASLAAVEENWQLRLDLVESSYQREVDGLRADTRRLATSLARARNPGFFRTTVGGFVIGVGISAVLVVGGYLLYLR